MLYLVATPIGNLGDITLRALEILKSVDFVASEDTRHTGLLLKHFEISKPQISCRVDNEHRAVERLAGILKEGKSIALVTDAGSPGISDPGYLIVHKALELGIEITMLPGANAVIPALVLSGLPMHSFTFRGFPPRKPGPRKRFFEIDKDMPHTLIYYESPYRLDDFFQDALEVFGDRPAALVNDLTKMYEKVDRASISALLEQVKSKKPKGEFAIVIKGAI